MRNGTNNAQRLFDFYVNSKMVTGERRILSRVTVGLSRHIFLRLVAHARRPVRSGVCVAANRADEGRLGYASSARTRRDPRH